MKLAVLDGISFKTHRCLRVVLLMSLVLPGACSLFQEREEEKEDGTWSVFALEYGNSVKFRHSVLIRGASKDERVPLSWWAWLIQPSSGDGRRILVDTGFDDEKLARQWRFKRHVPVPRLLRDLHIEPSSITDVVVTHSHWDHMGNVSPYKNARIWIQKEEFDWAVKKVSDEKPVNQGVRLKDVDVLKKARDENRLSLVAGTKEIAPGIIVHPGGKHTPFIQWVEVQSGGRSGTIVLATDIAYLYENIDKVVSSGSTLDPRKDVAEIKKMINKATRKELVIPGHDPEVARRFKSVGKHIYRIR